MQLRPTHPFICSQEKAEVANRNFDIEIQGFLRNWIFQHQGETLLQFDQSTTEYLVNNALRDFFLHSVYPLQQLLQQKHIAGHLGRNVDHVYFDPTSGDPLFACAEQRIYNLARRMDSEKMHVPFRSVHPYKQTEAGDNAAISTYPADSDQIRYNSGNHFTSRPANGNVFDENSKRCAGKSTGNIHILFKRGFLEDRLQDVKELVLSLNHAGEKELQFFVICSRHSLKEGHFGTSLLIMDPARPHFPLRVLVCDTLLKELPQHPRWWYHFITEYANVFGDGIVEIIEDLSHPLQKVNIKGEDPFLHDWDCPYYVTSMANALVHLLLCNPGLILNGTGSEIHQGMKSSMDDYYKPDQLIKERQDIKMVNMLKRWDSGLDLISQLKTGFSYDTSHEV